MNIVETKNLTKLFAKFIANKDINISIEKGEIRAIIGENGAGKTTLMNMLYGMIQPTSGEIYINGKQVKISSPKVAIEHGLGMVHQHFKLVPSLTIYENILLGTEVTRFAIVDTKKEKKLIQDLVDKYKFNLNIEDKVEDISIGAKQRVEILKMLYRDVEVLIFDEPTSVLTPQEVDDLIENLLVLREQGKTILIITHKLQEVKKLANTITVIRRGEVIGTIQSEGTSMEELAQMMVGRPVIMQVDKSGNKIDKNDVVFKIEDYVVKNTQGNNAVNKISLEVHKNEILGIAGVEGNGQTELAKGLGGMMTSCNGKVYLKGNDITNMWPNQLRRNKIGIIPEDRYEEGLCKDMKVSQNLIAGYHNIAPVCSRLFFNKKAVKDNYSKLVEQFDIRLSAEDPNVSGLSGGNAQKIIIAREFNSNPDFLLCCQPTRGVDVGSIETIHKEIIKFRNMGKAVLLISSELSEIMTLADRIAVMYKGEIVGEFKTDETTPEELGLYMTGAKRMTF
ncbi:MAG: ABC transporter ATP-binding protein [Oscillospiraceae bacterium]